MKLFVWDFHGVLENGTESSVLEITNMALEKFGSKRRMTEGENSMLFGRKWKEYFEYLVPGLSSDMYAEMQAFSFEVSEKNPEINTKHLRANDHAEDVVRAIHNSHHTQIVISNTSQRVLDTSLELIGLHQYFPEGNRFGIDSHRKSRLTKKECLQSFLSGKSFKSVISIGDSEGDMKLLQGLPCGVGYLFANPGKVHREAPCKKKIRDLMDVLAEEEVPVSLRAGDERPT